MVSRVFKGFAATAAALSFASIASANCGSLYCGQLGHGTVPSISSWTPSAPTPSYSTLSSAQADASYGTGSISQAYSSYDTQSFYGSASSVQGLGQNESLQATNCPVNVHGVDEGRVVGCYNVVKPVPQTTYYRVVRPVIYVRYPVPVAVPYTSPCHTVTHHSRYADWHTRGVRRGCR